MTPLVLWLRRIVAVLALLAAIAAGLAACGLALYIVPTYTARIGIIVAIGVAALAVVAWIGIWLDARLWRVQRRARFATCVSGLLTIVFAGALYGVVLRPTSLSHQLPVPRTNTEYWTLRTGSRIAYSEYDPPPGVAVRPEPIVFLHGGPGVFTFDVDHAFYRQFAADGFRVYLFDQAGSGLSDYLPHARDYTIERSMADLEAIREQIGAAKLILVGHSFGSTLAANYMARYPGHVAKVVFHSPGPIWNPDIAVDYSRTAAGPRASAPLRLIAAALLFKRNPDAAENLLPQGEAADIAASLLDPGAVVCKGAPAHVSVPPGLGFYPLVAILRTLGEPRGDPHHLLRANRTPAIVVYSECDFLGWPNVLDYRHTLPNLKVYYFPGAGHYIQLMQPERLTRVMRAFLLNQPDTIGPYTKDADPHLQGP